MSEQMISQVSNTQADTSQRYVQPAESVPTVAKETEQDVLEQGRAVKRPEEGNESDSQNQVRERISEERPKRMGDIYLKFQLDENNDLTIFMLDKERQTIIRTIPADEIARMSAGELIELFI